MSSSCKLLLLANVIALLILTTTTTTTKNNQIETTQKTQNNEAQVIPTSTTERKNVENIQLTLRVKAVPQLEHDKVALLHQQQQQQPQKDHNFLLHAQRTKLHSRAKTKHPEQQQQNVVKTSSTTAIHRQQPFESATIHLGHRRDKRSQTAATNAVSGNVPESRSNVAQADYVAALIISAEQQMQQRQHSNNLQINTETPQRNQNETWHNSTNTTLRDFQGSGVKRQIITKSALNRGEEARGEIVNSSATNLNAIISVEKLLPDERDADEEEVNLGKDKTLHKTAPNLRVAKKVELTKGQEVVVSNFSDVINQVAIKQSMGHTESFNAPKYATESGQANEMQISADNFEMATVDSEISKLNSQQEERTNKLKVEHSASNTRTIKEAAENHEKLIKIEIDTHTPPTSSAFSLDRGHMDDATLQLKNMGSPIDTIDRHIEQFSAAGNFSLTTTEANLERLEKTTEYGGIYTTANRFYNANMSASRQIAAETLKNMPSAGSHRQNVATILTKIAPRLQHDDAEKLPTDVKSSKSDKIKNIKQKQKKILENKKVLTALTTATNNATEAPTLTTKPKVESFLRGVTTGNKQKRGDEKLQKYDQEIEADDIGNEEVRGRARQITNEAMNSPIVNETTVENETEQERPSESDMRRAEKGVIEKGVDHQMLKIALEHLKMHKNSADKKVVEKGVEKVEENKVRKMSKHASKLMEDEKLLKYSADKKVVEKGVEKVVENEMSEITKNAQKDIEMLESDFGNKIKNVVEKVVDLNLNTNEKTATNHVKTLQKVTTSNDTTSSTPLNAAAVVLVSTTESIKSSEVENGTNKLSMAREFDINKSVNYLADSIKVNTINSTQDDNNNVNSISSSNKVTNNWRTQTETQAPTHVDNANERQQQDANRRHKIPRSITRAPDSSPRTNNNNKNNNNKMSKNSSKAPSKEVLEYFDVEAAAADNQTSGKMYVPSTSTESQDGIKLPAYGRATTTTKKTDNNQLMTTTEGLATEQMHMSAIEATSTATVTTESTPKGTPMGNVVIYDDTPEAMANATSTENSLKTSTSTTATYLNITIIRTDKQGTSPRTIIFNTTSMGDLRKINAPTTTANTRTINQIPALEAATASALTPTHAVGTKAPLSKMHEIMLTNNKYKDVSSNSSNNSVADIVANTSRDFGAKQTTQSPLPLSPLSEHDDNRSAHTMAVDAGVTDSNLTVVMAITTTTATPPIQPTKTTTIKLSNATTPAVVDYSQKLPFNSYGNSTVITLTMTPTIPAITHSTTAATTTTTTRTTLSPVSPLTNIWSTISPVTITIPLTTSMETLTPRTPHFLADIIKTTTTPTTIAGNFTTLQSLTSTIASSSFHTSTLTALTSLAQATTSSSASVSPGWPVKHASVMEGDVILGGLMMVHSREDSITCGPIMPQGGIQALEAMLYTLDQVNKQQLLPNITLGAHILDDCDKDTYGLEMAVDFIKGM